jgi:hypothetical protein
MSAAPGRVVCAAACDSFKTTLVAGAFANVAGEI